MTLSTTNTALLGRNGVPSYRNHFQTFQHTSETLRTSFTVHALIRMFHFVTISARDYHLQAESVKKSSRFLHRGAFLLHTLDPGLEASAEILKLLAPRNPRQEHVQAKRDLIIVESSPSRVLLALLKAKGMLPGDHVQQVTSPLELCFGVLLSPENISISFYSYLWLPAFRGLQGTSRTKTVTTLLTPLKLTDSFSSFPIGPFELGRRATDRIKSLFISGQCSKSKNCAGGVSQGTRVD
jgi:hypothetical protein